MPACGDTLEEEEEEEGDAMELLTCDKDGEPTSRQTLIWWDVSAWNQTDTVARVVGRRSGRSGCSVQKRSQRVSSGIRRSRIDICLFAGLLS